MRFSVLFLFALPAAIDALQCYSGRLAPGNPQPGIDPTCKDYCFSIPFVYGSANGLDMGCGTDDKCTSEGLNDQGYTCCRGDLCNGAAGAVKCYDGIFKKDSEAKNTVNCPSGFCYKVHVDVGTQEGSKKGCATADQCSSEGKNKETGGYCCKGDLCNAASGRTLLLTMMLAAIAMRR
ncbi:hypothetical protein PMAYCL1PPCAC_20895 [Pristionchus mayeri]|uniref:UPAR/Ly6 domain-containing protein n=1 Tax=Pristionchus mayeri TaxID=1317129 RepID=A0AAN5I424_9BILA|nr:hypothetical protein PMAYCL1PPCAC_20895 [Pristionchus mayeri]